MSRDRAAYMREYRAKHRLPATSNAAQIEQTIEELMARQASRIAQLEEEVRHLKAELAKRPDRHYDTHPFNSRPFTPVPKK